VDVFVLTLIEAPIFDKDCHLAGFGGNPRVSLPVQHSSSSVSLKGNFEGLSIARPIWHFRERFFVTSAESLSISCKTTSLHRRSLGGKIMTKKLPRAHLTMTPCVLFLPTLTNKDQRTPKAPDLLAA